MNAISLSIVPFDSYSAYQREREHSRKLEAQLARSNMLLRLEADRREFRGENVEHIRAFLKECAQ